MAPTPHRVTRRHRETHDTVTVTLEPVDDPLAPARPGQFHMLYAFGVGEVPISVSGLDRPGGTDHTIRAVGLTTAALSATGIGEIVGVRGPFGTTWGLDAARGGDVVVMGGGIGLAPLWPLVEQVVDQRDRFGSVSVLVGARSPDELILARQLSALAQRDDIWVGVTVDAATPEWRGRVGVVTTLVDAAPFDPPVSTAFLCGPETMMRFGLRALLDAGIPSGRIELSAERNMACAVGHCGHCQFGPLLICRDGPVLPAPRLAPLLGVREL